MMILKMDLMGFLFRYLKWIYRFMLKILNWITNNYFLKQQLSIPTLNSPVRRLTDTWQGVPQQGATPGPDGVVREGEDRGRA